MTATDWLDLTQSWIDGVMFGTTYALIGIGFTLIFGVMHKINLAYAAASIGAAYLSLLVIELVPTPLVYLFSAFAGGLLGALIYFVCFRFIPIKSPLATLMSTVGMLLVIEELMSHLTQGMPQNYPAMLTDIGLEIGDLYIRGDLMFVFALGTIAMVLLNLLLKRTRLGLATRAVAQQPVAAQLCGMGIDKTNASTFIIAGFLGGTAGAMVGAAIGVLSPLVAMPITVKGLVVTGIGGLGRIPGPIFQYWRGVTERDIYVMLLLFVFLVFRPNGLFAPPGGRD